MLYFKSINKLPIKLLVTGLMVPFLSYAVASCAAGQFELDIYKTNKISAATAKVKFSKELQHIADIMQSAQNLHSEKNLQLFQKSISSITHRLNMHNEYSYIGISPITYPGNKLTYITIDLVEKNDKKRHVTFLNSPNKTIRDPHNLIQKWFEYQKIGFSILLSGTQIAVKHCPAYHCLFGFEHPELKKYKAIFTTISAQDQSVLTKILREDKDENKRGAAAYLLAHIKNREELIYVLTPSIFDSSELVRNNVMRVLGFAINRHITHFPIDYAIKALAFPTTTDRNKALLIIAALAKNPHYSKYIIHHAGHQILDQLKLTQPNVHTLAYAILKQVSGKHFNDRDYQSWSLWLNQADRLDFVVRS